VNSKVTITTVLTVFVLLLAPATGSIQSQEGLAEKPSDTGKPSEPGKLPIVRVNEKVAKKLFLQPDGTILERTTHIFYTGDVQSSDNNAKGNSDAKGVKKGGPKGGGGSDGAENCYSFLENGMKWKTTEPFVVNPTNTDDIDHSWILEQFKEAANVWDIQISHDLYNDDDSELDYSASPDEKFEDGKNEIVFAVVQDESGDDLKNVIAVTYTWANWGAPKPFKQIVGYDMIFNDPYFQFGDATQPKKTEEAPMDIWNIASHEFGMIIA